MLTSPNVLLPYPWCKQETLVVVMYGEDPPRAMLVVPHFQRTILAMDGPMPMPVEGLSLKLRDRPEGVVMLDAKSHPRLFSTLKAKGILLPQSARATLACLTTIKDILLGANKPSHQVVQIINMFKSLQPVHSQMVLAVTTGEGGTG